MTSQSATSGAGAGAGAGAAEAEAEATRRSAWDALGDVWRAAFDEAWASFASGSAGVGAVITDERGAIVATGTEPGV